MRQVATYCTSSYGLKASGDRRAPHVRHLYIPDFSGVINAAAPPPPLTRRKRNCSRPRGMGGRLRGVLRGLSRGVLKGVRRTRRARAAGLRSCFSTAAPARSNVVRFAPWWYIVSPTHTPTAHMSVLPLGNVAVAHMSALQLGDVAAARAGSFPVFDTPTTCASLRIQFALLTHNPPLLRTLAPVFPRTSGATLPSIRCGSGVSQQRLPEWEAGG
eukprot:1183145-Prorocentrum_minimum.AAC.4